MEEEETTYETVQRPDYPWPVVNYDAWDCVWDDFCASVTDGCDDE